MYRNLADFEFEWTEESKSTQKLFSHLTDEAMHISLHENVRSAARLAWHITTTIPEMMQRTGLALTGPNPEAPIPATAKEILDTYNEASASLLQQIKAHWTDDTLAIEDEMYGEKWSRGTTLSILVIHQTHHRAQLTVVMRMLGLPVPGLYGPSKEEWTQYGMPAPAI